MGKICLKCKHERSSRDDPLIPASTCPQCGSVYAKVETALGLDSKKNESTLTDEEKIELIREKVNLEKQLKIDREISVVKKSRRNGFQVTPNEPSYLKLIALISFVIALLFSIQPHSGFFLNQNSSTPVSITQSIRDAAFVASFLIFTSLFGKTVFKRHPILMMFSLGMSASALIIYLTALWFKSDILPKSFHGTLPGVRGFMAFSGIFQFGCLLAGWSLILPWFFYVSSLDRAAEKFLNKVRSITLLFIFTLGALPILAVVILESKQFGSPFSALWLIFLALIVTSVSLLGTLIVLFKSTKSSSLFPLRRIGTILIVIILFFSTKDFIYTFSHELPAHLGNRNAQLQLGLEYFKKKNFVEIELYKDYHDAIKWFNEAAHQGQAEAQYYLGWIHSNGQGVPQHYQQGFHWYESAARQGHARARYQIGRMYADGLGVQQNHREAFAWYQLAAEQGIVPAQFCLAELYETGQGVTKDNRKAYYWYTRVASHREQLVAQYKIWLKYDKDIKWLAHAAEAGFAEAQYQLSVLEKEKSWNRRGFRSGQYQALNFAAEQGHAQAQYELGVWSFNNRPSIKDFNNQQNLERYKNSSYWLIRAAMQGHLQALKYLTELYHKQKLPQYDKSLETMFNQRLSVDRWANKPYIPRQWKKDSHALFLYKLQRSFRLDPQVTSYLLKIMIENHQELERLQDNIITVLKESANEGNAAAQVQLGITYKDGIGVPQNHTEALKWFRKAAEMWWKESEKPSEKWSMKQIGNVFPRTSAQTQLSLMYRQGLGVPIDIEEAEMWIAKHPPRNGWL